MEQHPEQRVDRVERVERAVEPPTTHRWFTPWGWTYRPTSAAGAVLVMLALAFCVNVFLAIDRHSHSATDTLYGVFPFVVPTLLLLDWVASKSSGARPRRR